MKIIKNDDESSLSHTKWNCQYHIVFIPKYRRKAIYSKLRSDIGKYIRRLCEYKGVEIVEANACPDHIHMLVKIPPKISISSFMGYLKGKSSLMIFEEHANLKYNYGNRHFWAQGYYVSTVGLNKNTIKKLTTDNIKETFPKTINPQYLSIINRLAPINKRLAIFAKSKLTPTRILSKYSHNRYLEK